jgi:hypothetical protein
VGSRRHNLPRFPLCLGTHGVSSFLCQKERTENIRVLFGAEGRCVSAKHCLIGKSSVAWLAIGSWRDKSSTMPVRMRRCQGQNCMSLELGVTLRNCGKFPYSVRKESSMPGAFRNPSNFCDFTSPLWGHRQEWGTSLGGPTAKQIACVMFLVVRSSSSFSWSWVYLRT